LVALNGLLAVIFYFESIAVDFEFFIALKFFEQIAVQLGLTLSFTILAESLPSSKHGTYLSLVGINFSFGEVMSIGNLYFNLPDYRKAYLWISLFTIPYLITFVAAV
jgi:MFS family permease